MRRRAIVLIAVLAAALVAGVALALPIIQNAMRPPAAPDDGPLEWSGPIRVERAEAAVHPRAQWDDERDAASGWVDITRLSVVPEFRNWHIELAAWPPPRAAPASALIAHGLVVDASGDGAADYVLGLDNNAPTGEFHVWLTDLATGETEERVGPPYGDPIDFAHPHELVEVLPGAPAEPPTVRFILTETFSPPELFDARSFRFYAWASLTQAGEVVAWDYAPDRDWLQPAVRRPRD